MKQADRTFQPVAIERRHQQHIALQPHADRDAETDQEQRDRRHPHALPPQRLQRREIEDDRAPIAPGIGPDETIPHRLRLAPASPGGGKQLGQIAIGGHQPGREQQDAEHIEVARRHQRLQPQHGPQPDGQHRHHRKARKGGAQHEIGREDGGDPARHRTGRHQQRDFGMDRDHQRHRNGGGQPIALLPAMPMLRRSAPAKRAQPEENLPAPRLGSIARRRQVGQDADIPEEHRHDQIGQHREKVPGQRALELRPHAHRAGVGRHPVEAPRPAQMQDGIKPRAHDGEQRHRLGEAIEAVAPLLPDQQQHGGNQRAGMADPQPPDIVGNGKAPGDRDIIAPDARPAHEQHRDRHQEQRQQAQRDQEHRPPHAGRGEAGGHGDDAACGRFLLLRAGHAMSPRRIRA